MQPKLLEDVKSGRPVMVTVPVESVAVPVTIVPPATCVGLAQLAELPQEMMPARGAPTGRVAWAGCCRPPPNRQATATIAARTLAGTRARITGLVGFDIFKTPPIQIARLRKLMPGTARN
jgi:hypothetical protein